MGEHWDIYLPHTNLTLHGKHMELSGFSRPFLLGMYFHGYWRQGKTRFQSCLDSQTEGLVCSCCFFFCRQTWWLTTAVTQIECLCCLFYHISISFKIQISQWPQEAYFLHWEFAHLPRWEISKFCFGWDEDTEESQPPHILSTPLVNIIYEAI